MKVLILAEHKSGKLKNASLELVQAAQGKDTFAVVFGADAKEAAETLKPKVKEVLWVSSDKFNAYHPEAYTEAMEKIVQDKSVELLLGNSSALGRDLLPKVAARCGASIAADVIGLDLQSGVKATKPFYSGKAVGQIEFRAVEKLKVVSLRPNSLSLTELPDLGGQVTELSVDFDFAASPLQFVEKKASESKRPDLSEAAVVVSGGRSLKTSDNFKIVFDLADALGGAAGASRAAVDEGLVPHEMQVGQTGKTVNPKLYIACGISGAIQHLAGMRTSKVIVAINKDPEAPIFGKADYGIVGDLFEVLPALTEEVKKTLS